MRQGFETISVAPVSKRPHSREKLIDELAKGKAMEKILRK